MRFRSPKVGETASLVISNTVSDVVSNGRICKSGKKVCEYQVANLDARLQNQVDSVKIKQFICRRPPVLEMMVNCRQKVNGRNLRLIRYLLIPN